jgi:hypothetical protein
MGVSLAYCTTAAVPQHVKDAIEAEAQQLAPPAHGWWTENLCFFDPGEDDGRLYGGTKIFLIGYSTNDGGYMEVDPDEDSLMAYRDTSFILDKLAEWSRKHGVSWQIDCAGEPIGTINRGQRDRQLQEYVDDMKASFPWPLDFEDRAKAISEKYASRW